MITIERTKEILASAKGRRILVIGDVMVDRYVHGKVHRISPEAPVPVVHVTRETVLPGGAANVALNILALGGAADLAGIVGRDAAGEQVCVLLKKEGVGLKHIVASGSVATTVKTRVIAERQQVVRIDTENPPEDFF
jgi:rfaE bifunctional protein kinase chain/domain